MTSPAVDIAGRQHEDMDREASMTLRAERARGNIKYARWTNELPRDSKSLDATRSDEDTTTQQLRAPDQGSAVVKNWAAGEGLHIVGALTTLAYSCQCYTKGLSLAEWSPFTSRPICDDGGALIWCVQLRCGRVFV